MALELINMPAIPVTSENIIIDVMYRNDLLEIERQLIMNGEVVSFINSNQSNLTRDAYGSIIKRERDTLLFEAVQVSLTNIDREIDEDGYRNEHDAIADVSMLAWFRNLNTTDYGVVQRYINTNTFTVRYAGNIYAIRSYSLVDGDTSNLPISVKFELIKQ